MQFRLPRRVITAASLFLIGTLGLSEACQIEKRAELPLGYAIGLATIEVKINGKTAIFGIDTGAQTLVTPAAAAELGLIRDWRRTIARGTTATIIVNNVMIRDFGLGGDHYSWKSVPKIALPQQKLPPAVRPPAGLIGMDILGNYDIDLDYFQHKITLYSVKGCGRLTPPSYGGTTAVKFAVTGGRNIIIPIDVDGAKLNALFDTGATMHMISRFGARKAGVTEMALRSDPQFQATGAGNVSRPHALHKFAKINVGGMLYQSVPVGVLTQPLTSGDFLIGQPIWLQRRVWISNATHVIYFENSAYRFQKNQAGASGAFPAEAPKINICGTYTSVPLGFCGTGQVPSADANLRAFGNFPPANTVLEQQSSSPNQ